MRPVVFLPLAFVLLAFAQGNALGQGSDPVSSAPADVQKNTSAKIAELTSKAESGDVKAQTALGQAYADGNGVPQDFQQALHWYRKAASQGNGEAENEIGILYRYGNGVEKSKEEALSWYRKAASHGTSAAMFNIGVAYYNGDGTFVDDTKSYTWFLAAEEAGDSSAHDAVQRSERERDSLRQIDAYLDLAEMYRIGQELPKNQAGAAKWYRKAADTGSLSAQVHLAAMMILGQLAPPDFQQARQWCERAAKKNYSPGAFCMGLLYRDGVLGPPSEDEAVKWFDRAAELGNGSAMIYLGRDYWRGNGVNQDTGKAYQWLLLARSAGSVEADEDIENIRKELTPAQTKKVEQKAMKWSREHSRLPTPPVVRLTP